MTSAENVHHVNMSLRMSDDGSRNSFNKAETEGKKGGDVGTV